MNDANVFLELIKASEELLKVPELGPEKYLYSDTLLKVTNLHNVCYRVRMSGLYADLIEDSLGGKCE